MTDPMFDDSFPPPPHEPGPLGTLIVNILGPPFLFCFITLLGYLGYVFLVSVGCALNVSSAPVATICVFLIVGLYVRMWAEDVGLRSVIGLAASFVALMTALAAICSGHGVLAGVSFCIALITSPHPMQAIKKSQIRRTEKSWLYELLKGYLLLCGGMAALGWICLTVTGLLFGVDL